MKKHRFLFGFLLLTAIMMVISNSCKKDDDDPTPQDTIFTDPRDGNVYKIVTIGTQVWFAENIRYLPEVVGSVTGSMTTPYSYVYDYEGTDVDSAKARDQYSTYGVLYNFAAAQNACPTGWHLPSVDEWTALTDFLGGSAVAGGKLKDTGTVEAGTGLWNAPNTGATNEKGFTALPGGFRNNFIASFTGLGSYGDWWSGTEIDNLQAWRSGINHNLTGIGKDESSKDYGFSVRCLKD